PDSRAPPASPSAYPAWSHSLCILSPDIFMDLQIEPRGQPIAQHPGNERARIQLAVHRRQKNLALPGQPVAPHHVAGPLVVALIAQHELDRIAPGLEPAAL